MVVGMRTAVRLRRRAGKRGADMSLPPSGLRLRLPWPYDWRSLVAMSLGTGFFVFV